MLSKKCYVCGQQFQPEDFSTFFVIGDDTEEYMAHDDCLEELISFRQGDSKMKIWETGHKIWGNND